MAMSPRESAAFITAQSKHVTISSDGIERTANLVAKGFVEEKFGIHSWKSQELHPKGLDEISTINWIFFVDTLNFSFWSEAGKEYKVQYKGKEYTGYWSLCAAVNRAIEENYAITSAEFYSSVSLDTLRHIFRSETGQEIPLLQERHEILHETGKILQKFNNTFATCLLMCGNSAKNLLGIIVENFPSYRDEAVYCGEKVSFYKRAQILIGDIWACFEGQGYGAFQDIDTLTIFADYRVPQALAYLGALQYSDELMETLKCGEGIQNGSGNEVEIRGATIMAVELICQLLKSKRLQYCISSDFMINATLIDHYLWEYRRRHSKEMEHIPFHKVRCIYY